MRTGSYFQEGPQGQRPRDSRWVMILRWPDQARPGMLHAELLFLISLQTYRSHQPFLRSSRDGPETLSPQMHQKKRGRTMGRGPEVKQTADSPLKWGQGRRQKRRAPGTDPPECRLGWARGLRVQTVGCSREPTGGSHPTTLPPELGPRLSPATAPTRRYLPLQKAARPAQTSATQPYVLPPRTPSQWTLKGKEQAPLVLRS